MTVPLEILLRGSMEWHSMIVPLIDYVMAPLVRWYYVGLTTMSAYSD